MTTISPSDQDMHIWAVSVFRLLNPHCIFKSNPDYRKAPPSVMDMSEEEGGEDNG